MLDSDVNFPDVDGIRKSATINNELLRLNVDIAALSETRLAESGKIKEKDYTIFWQGLPQEARRERGVGFAVRNHLLSAIEPPRGLSERIMTLRILTYIGFMTIVSVYAPTELATSEAKDAFYLQLSDTLTRVPSSDRLTLLGDFNARVGADHEAWKDCLGSFGVGRLNDNGQRMLELCSAHGLCVTNTFFDTKMAHRTSWRHPRSGHWHQLDLVCVRRKHLSDTLNTRAYHSADCNTDHSLVLSKIRLSPKRIHSQRKQGRVKINADNTKIQELQRDFQAEISLLEQPSNTDSCTRVWDSVSASVYSKGKGIFGTVRHKSLDWFSGYADTLNPLIEKKRQALIANKAANTRGSLRSLQSARRETRREVRKCANAYWQELADKIQAAFERGDLRAMYDGIKSATGRFTQKCAPIKALDGSMLTQPAEQLNRWAEHYKGLFTTGSCVTREALSSVPDLPTMAELDRLPEMEELRLAISALTVGKAPGEDSISAELLRAGGEPLLDRLYDILMRCWNEGVVPQSMRDCTMVTLYKNKGDRSDCNNYRGISLLSVAGKAFARVLLKRLQVVAERVYPESQCGFRAGRSTIDMAFSLKLIQEKCIEQQMPLFVVFLDLTKAFDTVNREGLFQILEKVGCPPKLLALTQAFHINTKARVKFEGELSDSFEYEAGVKQGCVLAPTLFGIFLSTLLHSAFINSTEGVELHTRTDGKLFNLARLRAVTKRRSVLIRELLFADDAAIVTHSDIELQSLVSKFSKACDEFGLKISIKKTVVLAQGAPPPTILIHGAPLQCVDSFCYLGCSVMNTHGLEKELSTRIGKAASMFGRLSKRVWTNSHLSLSTKFNVYRACICSVLLYGSETWPSYRRHEKKLNTFHMRCLRKILGLTWQDKVPYAEIITRSKQPTMYALLKIRRLRWLGHVVRMQDHRIPKIILFGQLAEGKRPVGRPKLRFADVVKRDMKDLKIPLASWETIARDRPGWKRAVRSGAEAYDSGWIAAQRIRRQQRHDRRAVIPLVPPS